MKTTLPKIRKTKARQPEKAVTPTIKISAQRLRSLTTGLLHTEIGCVYEDLELITRQEGLMTHMLPRALRAIEPWLREHVTEPRFWDGTFDQSHVGTVDLPIPTVADLAAMFERYKAQPNPLIGKTVIAAVV